MIAVDTSVVVAGFASWHESNAAAHAVLAERPAVPSHVLLETYAALTSLPPPHRVAPRIVAEFLDRQFPTAPLHPSAAAVQDLVAGARDLGLTGGSLYDALIGVTAARAGARLVSLDGRAARTYALLDVDHELLAA